MLSKIEIKKELVEMLKWFSNYCEIHGIHYSIAAGTLLGAIRHKGFIPWDDDIDVLLLRNDYNKLRLLRNDIIENTEYDIVCAEDGTCEFPFIKLINKSIRVNQKNLKTKTDYLWIDIFPFDNVPDNVSSRKKIYKKVRKQRLMLESSLIDIRRAKGSFSVFVKKFFHFIFKMYGAMRLAKKMSKISQRYLNKTNYVGCITWGYGPQDIVSIDDFMNNVYVDFEGIKVNAMSCWDQHLKNVYGDYMKLPPEDKRVAHDIEAWYE